MEKPFSIHFSNGATATAIRAHSFVNLSDTLTTLGLPGSRPVLVVVGGAGELRHYHLACLHSLFAKVLVPIAQTLNAVVIDGGTDAGVMQMMGRARHAAKATFPLVGVLPSGMAILPQQSPPQHPDAAPLEAHHTHFVFTPEANPSLGWQWGDESPWIAQIANVLAEQVGSVAVLINGGEVTWQDAAHNVNAGRTLIAIAGTGRAADALTAALHGTITDKRAVPILTTGLLKSIPLEDLDGLARTIGETLSTGLELWQEKIHIANF
jgi:hypothetical protein